MSVLIKGMEMPKDCISCEFSYPMFEGIWYCGYAGKYIDEENDEEYYEAAYSYDCPLVEVPTPHGRLIDAGALLTERRKSKYYHLKNGDIAIPVIDIEHAPTIIEAEVIKE